MRVLLTDYQYDIPDIESARKDRWHTPRNEKSLVDPLAITRVYSSLSPELIFNLKLLR